MTLLCLFCNDFGYFLLPLVDMNQNKSWCSFWNRQPKPPFSSEKAEMESFFYFQWGKKHSYFVGVKFFSQRLVYSDYTNLLITTVMIYWLWNAAQRTLRFVLLSFRKAFNHIISSFFFISVSSVRCPWMSDSHTHRGGGRCYDFDTKIIMLHLCVLSVHLCVCVFECLHVFSVRRCKLAVI